MHFDHIFILHGCPPSEELITPLENRWMNWLAKELRKKGFDAIAPSFPTSWNPTYEEWKKEFSKYSVTKESLLIGHSCGGAFFSALVVGK